jgi:type III restriction enzyme
VIELKDYQVRVLESLREFFKECSKNGHPAQAFQKVLQLNGSPIMPYLSVPSQELAGTPYICLRVPTGGGKTLLAAYTTGLAKDELLHAEHAVILWLVPSNTILEQTVKALRDNRHPYRRALEIACGRVEVLAIDEALNLSRAAADEQTIVIVATIQSFRVEDTSGRRVYERSGMLPEHLLNLSPDMMAGLFPDADGKPKASLVNVLRLRRPIVIVDEAHNARTDLAFSMLADLNPSCIVEFTATPARQRNPSNVLHHVSASELKAANMIKLPLRVITRHPSQRDQLLGEAVTLRSDLEKMALIEAQATGKYLRPIMLIQAERVDGCEALRERLISDYGILKEQIIISTGTLDELKKVENIDDSTCPIRIIITVEKLREGWDCPFAYVLCSLKETHSATAIEQIIGRILRLPGAEAKQHGELNCAYAFSVSLSLPEVLGELREALERNGFTTAEAGRIILPVSQGSLPLGTQPKTVQLAPGDIDKAAVQNQLVLLAGKVAFDSDNNKVTIFAPLGKEESERLVACVLTPTAQTKLQEAVEIARELDKAFGGTGEAREASPYEKQENFIVPRLAVVENGQLFEFESTFLSDRPWQLITKDASLSDAYDPRQRPAAKAGILDVSTIGRIETSALPAQNGQNFISTLHHDVFKLQEKEDWTMESLIVWLDRHILHPDIPDSEAADFILNALRGLMAKYSLETVDALAVDRFRLRDEIEAKIQQHRDRERNTAFQQALLPDSGLIVSDEFAINFAQMSYEPGWLFEDDFKFQKHYFGRKPGELRQYAPSGEVTAEFKCAQFIDSLPQVRFWFRNLARRESSFRLLTVDGWFYPDFVCQLTDGRAMVVEYKGAHLFTDAANKRAVGSVWESRSNGRCLFVMPTGTDFGEITAKLKASDVGTRGRQIGLL